MASSGDSASVSTFISLEEISNVSVTEGSTKETPLIKLIAEARLNGYRSVCFPLTTQKWKDRWTETCLLPVEHDSLPAANLSAGHRAELWRSNPAFELGEVTMTRFAEMEFIDEAEGVTFMVSDWLELDAEDDWVRDDYEVALQQELAYASYLNLQTAILPPPRNRGHVASYARAVNACLAKIPFMQLSIRLPIYEPPDMGARRSPKRNSTRAASMALLPRVVVPSETSTKKDTKGLPGELNATWEMWDLIRTVCDYDPRLTLTLDLSLPIPSTPFALEALRKWNAESVRHIFIPASSFIANAGGYPVLSKGTQAFIQSSMTHRPTLILAGTKSGLHSRGGEAAYAQYVRHLEETSPALQAIQRAGTVENFAQGYLDYLQAPLQPLMDNLQSVTYHTFEQDPVKYWNYEEAVYRALLYWPETDRLVICVAGAGRGPLVSRCLSAMDRACRSAVVYVIEKNPNAWITLQNRKQTEWGSKVELLFGDMRVINLPEQVDILVSELLGSFGDNELSPECLDGAARFLKPKGISIPASYTAHLAPLSSSKLFNEARAYKDAKSMETPYVVMFQEVNILSGDATGMDGCGPQIQECWEFEHPRKDLAVDAQGLPFTNSHNTRSAKLRFHIPQAGVLHGLAGYFEAVLYGNVGLSIHPHRKDQISKDMLSWFPLFFPFKEPLYLPSNAELHVSIWRRTNRRQVWYEWYAESFISIGKPAPPSGGGSSSSSGKSGPMSPMPMSVIGRKSQIPSPLGNGTFTFPPPSPLVDAVDSPIDRKGGGRVGEDVSGNRFVKIGQTSLHNPGGRSSWIGL